jgi:hypothetical protein
VKLPLGDAGIEKVGGSISIVELWTAGWMASPTDREDGDATLEKSVDEAVAFDGRLVGSPDGGFWDIKDDDWVADGIVGGLWEEISW